MRIILLAPILAMATCKPVAVDYTPKPQSVEVGKSGEVKVEGAAKTPTKVDTKNTDSLMPIPEGSTFVFNEKLGTLTLTVSKATQMAVNRSETVVQGPVAFDPPKPPSPSDLATAKSDFWVNLGLKAGLAVGAALAVFGLVRGWDLIMYGGGSIAAACAFGIFVENHPILLTFIGLGVAACLIGPALWHLKLKHIKNETNGAAS